MSKLIEIEPLTPTIGATVHGVDLAQPISDELFAEIQAAFLEHLVPKDAMQWKQWLML